MFTQESNHAAYRLLFIFCIDFFVVMMGDAENLDKQYGVTAKLRNFGMDVKNASADIFSYTGDLKNK